MRYNGKIKNLNHIVISDPTYDEDVTCRYERNNIKEKDWFVDIDIYPVSTPITDKYTAKGTEFFLFLYKDKRLSQLKENGTISYLRGIKLKETDIGMDTACIALGINEKADEIIEERESWQPECALSTLTDGIFGTVKEGTLENNLAFIWLSGYFDEDAQSMDEIIDYLEYQLNIADLKKDLENSYNMQAEKILERIHKLTVDFKELTKEDERLLNHFKNEPRFSNIGYAGAYLAGIAVRNEQRKAGNLEGEMEHSPYSELQEKLIAEYTELKSQFDKLMNEYDKETDIEDIDI